MLKEKDKLLLTRIQSDFPIFSRPFKKLAVRTGLSEKGLIKRVKFFKRRGFIRYLGPVLDLKKAGLKSTLIAMSAPEKSLKRIVRIINGYPQVSHNYLRSDNSIESEDEFNLWFTLCANSQGELSRLVKEIKKKSGVKKVLNLKTRRVFKIDARFKVY